jgi:hypothetical protein
MGEPRTWSLALIAVVLAYHIGTPLSYYLGDRVYDERFSWRMFSTVRLQECEIVVTETVSRDGQPVEVPTPVAKDVQAAWVGVLKRMRPSVIEKYLERRCDTASATQAKLVGRCRDTDGSQLPEQRFVMACEDHSLSVEVAR